MLHVEEGLKGLRLKSRHEVDGPNLGLLVELLDLKRSLLYRRTSALTDGIDPGPLFHFLFEQLEALKRPGGVCDLDSLNLTTSPDPVGLFRGDNRTTSGLEGRLIGVIREGWEGAEVDSLHELIGAMGRQLVSRGTLNQGGGVVGVSYVILLIPREDDGAVGEFILFVVDDPVATQDDLVIRHPDVITRRTLDVDIPVPCGDFHMVLFVLIVLFLDLVAVDEGLRIKDGRDRNLFLNNHSPVVSDVRPNHFRTVIREALPHGVRTPDGGANLLRPTTAIEHLLGCPLSHRDKRPVMEGFLNRELHPCFQAEV